MTNVMGYRQNLSANTDQGPSRNVWSGIPWDDIASGHKAGVAFHDDFIAGPQVPTNKTIATFGPYTAYASDGCSILNGAEQGGTLLFTTDASNEGAAIAGNPVVKIAHGEKDCAFECRVKRSALTDDQGGFFIGLMGNQAVGVTIPIAADGTIASVNLVGFHQLEGDGDTFDSIYRANGVAVGTVAADAVTIVADTYVKLGFRYSARNKVLTYYKDGVALADTYTVTSTAGNPFPNDVPLGLCAGILGENTSAPTNELDWWRVAQEF